LLCVAVVANKAMQKLFWCIVVLLINGIFVYKSEIVVMATSVATTASEGIEDSLSLSDVTAVQNAATTNRYTQQFDDDIENDELDSQVIIIVNFVYNGLIVILLTIVHIAFIFVTRTLSWHLHVLEDE